MHAFDVLGDPVRRRILELLAERELRSGEIVEIIQREFGITQAAVSQHLRVLRDSGFATVRVDAQRRIYAVDPHLFSPAEVVFRNIQTGNSFAFGRLETTVLARSFGVADG